MRELHEGIELLRSEREGGPFVWRNWDKWVDRCEQVVTWLDQQVIESKSKTTLAPSEAWKKRGFVCGVEWPKFRKTIEQYRKWLEDHYGGMHNINERLVFAHNDVRSPRHGGIWIIFMLMYDSLGTIRQYSPPYASGRVTSSPTSKRAQAACGHRLRICQRELARAGVCKSLCKLIVVLLSCNTTLTPETDRMVLQLPRRSPTRMHDKVLSHSGGATPLYPRLPHPQPLLSL
jgi:hypothetical protein